MFFSLLGSLLMFAVASCGATKNTNSETKHFFSNSKRRDATLAEAKLVGFNRVGPGGLCTSFFVANRDNKPLMISARHCLRRNPLEWCKKAMIDLGNLNPKQIDFDYRVRIGLPRYGGASFPCKRIITTSGYNGDLFMFELKGYTFKGAPDLQSFVPPYHESLGLADFEPEVGMSLQMIGYPNDPWRQERLTTTENCKVTVAVDDMGGSVNSNTMPVAGHKCSTYGGNSGGPMLWRDHGIVLGLPYSYFPLPGAPDEFGYSRENPYARENRSAEMALMTDFVAAYRDTLTAEGVKVAAKPPGYAN